VVNFTLKEGGERAPGDCSRDHPQIQNRNSGLYERSLFRSLRREHTSRKKGKKRAREIPRVFKQIAPRDQKEKVHPYKRQ